MVQRVALPLRWAELAVGTGGGVQLAFGGGS